MTSILIALFNIVGALLFSLIPNAVLQSRVDNPQPGDVLKGVIEIRGTIQAESFESYDVSFAYNDDTTNTWFIIQSGIEPVEDGQLALWDTATIADGIYRLKVIIRSTNGKTEELIVENLRIRNYTPVETKPVQPVAETSITSVIDDVTATNPIGVTPLPANPAQVSPRQFWTSFVAGIVLTGIVFLILIIRVAIRNRRRNGKI